MLSFSDLPLDVGRLIMAKAVIQAEALSCNLTLVSSVIQQLVDPLIFRHLAFSHDAIFHAYAKTVSHESPSERVRRLGSFVWSISVFANVDEDGLERILVFHPSLQCVYLNDTIPTLTTRAISKIPSSLTRLSASFSGGVPRWSWPLLAGLTHLDLSNLNLGKQALPEMSALPRLRAVVIGGEDSDYSTFWSAVSVLTHLETIIWFVNVTHMKDFRALHHTAEGIAKGEIDPRVVVCLTAGAQEENDPIPSYIVISDLIGNSFSCFNMRSYEGSTVWEKAERVKRARMASQGASKSDSKGGIIHQ